MRIVTSNLRSEKRDQNLKTSPSIPQKSKSSFAQVRKTMPIKVETFESSEVMSDDTLTNENALGGVNDDYKSSSILKSRVKIEVPQKEENNSERRNINLKYKLKKKKMKAKGKNRLLCGNIVKPPHTLQLNKVWSSVTAMFQLEATKGKSESVSLFMNDLQPVHMIVKCIKIPEIHNKNFRFVLPHPLVDSSSDVCLFVPDLKKGKNVDHEPTIEHYMNILKTHNITGISQVMPVRQMRVEYDQYELKRHLVNQFDFFLSDGRISGHVLGLLGKEIYKRRKLPVPVNFRANNLEKEFKTALSKTVMIMNGRGIKTSLKVGHSGHTVEQLAENIMAVAAGLAEHFPGGWANIRSLHIHLQDSSPIPVYINLKSSNEVEIPVPKPTKPKKAVAVEGELSTFPGTHVTVLPSGEVIVKKMKTKEDEEMNLSDSDWEDYNSDEEMAGDDLRDILMDRNKKGKNKPTPSSDDEKNTPNSDDGNEHTAEAAENTYLSKWTKQWKANIEEENKKRKKQKVLDAEEPAQKKQKISKNKKKKHKSLENKTKIIQVTNYKKQETAKVLKNVQLKSQGVTLPEQKKKQKTTLDKKSKSKKKRLAETTSSVKQHLKSNTLQRFEVTQSELQIPKLSKKNSSKSLGNDSPKTKRPPTRKVKKNKKGVDNFKIRGEKVQKKKMSHSPKLSKQKKKMNVYE